MAWLQVSFFSNLLQRSVPLQIVIPTTAANRSPEKRYKTLYLLHGYFGNCADWLLNGNVSELSQEYNICIVMPSGNNDFYVDAPSGAKSMSRFISEELVDFTRRMLPLSGKREDTLVGGLSMGGYGALYNSLMHSEVFGHAIALSSPLFFENGQIESMPDTPDFMGICKGYYREIFMEDLSAIRSSTLNPKNAAKYLLENNKPIPDLYIACGWNDMLKFENRRLCENLDELGVPFVYEEGPGSHEWAFWTPYLRRGLEHALPGEAVPMKNPFWIEKDEEERGLF